MASSESSSESKQLLVPPVYEIKVGEKTSKEDFIFAVKEDPCTEWSQFCMFNSNKKILYSSSPVDDEDITFILENLISEDAAFSSGILFGGVRYDVHRWYENLVIGRNGVAGRGAGICVIKWKIPSSEDARYAVITYGFPILSAKAVPDLKAFLTKWGNTDFGEGSSSSSSSSSSEASSSSSSSEASSSSTTTSEEFPNPSSSDKTEESTS